MKSKICGTIACISFLAMLGVAGNSDLGYETNFGALCIKAGICLAVFITSLKIGGFLE